MRAKSALPAVPPPIAAVESMPKTKKPLVIVTRKLPDASRLRMRELFDARLNPDDKPMTPSQLAEAIKTADVLVPTVTDRIDASVLSPSRATNSS